MSADSIDGERLQKLLGGAELSKLRQRLRARYERGAVRDEFILTDLRTHERRALSGLLGRRTLAAGSMRLRRSELDTALEHAGIASTLRDALEFLDGPVLDRRAEQAARQQSWDAAFSCTEEPRLVALLADVAGAALVKRLSGSDAQHAQALLAQAARVLTRLPGRGMSLAQLAADVLGDSHGLDNGRAVATIVLRACAADPSIDAIDAIDAIEAADLQDADESSRERWARLGVTVNELALPVLCLNLLGLHTDASHPPAAMHADASHPPAAMHTDSSHPSAVMHTDFAHPSAVMHTDASHPPAAMHTDASHPPAAMHTDASHPTAVMHTDASHPPAAMHTDSSHPSAVMHTDFAHPPGEPLHLSLRWLLRRPPAWAVAGRDVFVCENPNIVAIAADRLGPACAPLICTDGMPSAAQQTLLAQLAAAGARLRYHGDFDWAGLVIGNFVIREFGAEPWRFGKADYLAATAEHGIALRGEKPVVAQWDPGLTAAMAARGVIVHEEGVVEMLISDLDTTNN